MSEHEEALRRALLDELLRLIPLPCDCPDCQTDTEEAADG